MIYFFYESTLQNGSSISLSIIVQILTFITAAIAIFIAWKNLNGFRRTQFIQTNMNVINLEKDLRIKRTELKAASFEYTRVTDVSTEDDYNKELIRQKNLDKDIAFELYVSAADKLASLINTKQFEKQQESKNWIDEYIDLFKETKEKFDNHTTFIPGKMNMINNIEVTLKNNKD